MGGGQQTDFRGGKNFAGRGSKKMGGGVGEAVTNWGRGNRGWQEGQQKITNIQVWLTFRHGQHSCMATSHHYVILALLDIYCIL